MFYSSIIVDIYISLNMTPRTEAQKLADQRKKDEKNALKEQHFHKTRLEYVLGGPSGALSQPYLYNDIFWM